MATKVGLLHLSLLVGDARSLKDKRRIVKSFKDRLRARHNVSAAEVDQMDSIRRAVLAVAMVGNDGRYLEGALQRICNAAETARGMVLLDSRIEWL